MRKFDGNFFETKADIFQEKIFELPSLQTDCETTSRTDRSEGEETGSDNTEDKYWSDRF